METKDTTVQLLEKAVRPNIRVEKAQWEPPFLRIYDGDGFLIELWKPDLEAMLKELESITEQRHHLETKLGLKPLPRAKEEKISAFEHRIANE